MKSDIVIAGVGGQGILTIASIMGRAAVTAGFNIKQSEVHGMAQRGGAVVAHFRVSDREIYSDLISPGSADVVLAMEPLEALRQLPSLKKEGVVLANSTSVENIPDYPQFDELKKEIESIPRHILIDADALAVDAGSRRAVNMVMLGLLSAFVEMDEDVLKNTIRRKFEAKGDRVVSVNLKAFDAGRREG